MDIRRLRNIALGEVQPLFEETEWSLMGGSEAQPAALHLLAFYKAIEAGSERKKAAVALLKSVDRLDEIASRDGADDGVFDLVSIKVRMDAHQLAAHLEKDSAALLLAAVE